MVYRMKARYTLRNSSRHSAGLKQKQGKLMKTLRNANNLRWSVFNCGLLLDSQQNNDCRQQQRQPLSSTAATVTLVISH